VSKDPKDIYKSSEKAFAEYTQKESKTAAVSGSFQEEWILSMMWLDEWSNRKHDCRRRILLVKMKTNSEVHLKKNEWGSVLNFCLCLI
jgi:hypothetical protein